MPEDFRLRLRFWGVRGTIPTPAVENLSYGGNTSCVEIRTPENLIVIDCGSGARNLGIALEREFAGAKCRIDMLMTHYHWDHIQGLPLFDPLFSPAAEITFHARNKAAEIKAFLEGQMAHPYFPASLDFATSKREFVELGAEQPLRKGSLSIFPFPLFHPQGATGYRIERDGAVIVHASDLEHGDPHLDSVLRDYSQNADVLVFDAQYTTEEYDSKRGWGHSTWLEATQVARDCGVKQLVLFHHDPGHSDDFLDEVVRQARRYFPNTIAAKEGWTADL